MPSGFTERASRWKNPSTLTGTQRVGWGTLFSGKPGGFAWFHIAIATPVLLDDLRAKLERVFVFYKTSGASIRNVHVYDGPRKVKAFDGLTLQGDYSGKIVPANTWAFDPPRSVGFSVGISVGVAFDIGMDSAITTNVLFTTAGADFRFGVGDEIRRTIDRQSPVRPPGP